MPHLWFQVERNFNVPSVYFELLHTSCLNALVFKRKGIINNRRAAQNYGKECVWEGVGASTVCWFSYVIRRDMLRRGDSILTNLRKGERERVYRESGQVTVLYYFCFFFWYSPQALYQLHNVFLNGSRHQRDTQNRKCLPSCRKLTLIFNGTREKESHDMAFKLPREC